MDQMRRVIAGRYRLLRIIGSGGTGRVWLASDLLLGKVWAVKLLPSGCTNSEDEIRMLKKLSHPRLPRIVDVVRDGEELCVVMDHIAGEPLDEYSRRRGGLEEREVLEIGIQLAGILGYLHTRTEPVIYRDLKPANIMLCARGEVMLLDLGSATDRSCRSAEMQPGTPGFAAPEQYGERGRADVRSDIYSLGRTLEVLLAGTGDGRQGEDRLPELPKTVSADTGEILRRCTERRPVLRYQTMSDLEDVLRDSLTSVRAGVAVRRRQGLSAVLLILAGMFFLLAGGTVRQTILADLEEHYVTLLLTAEAEEEEARREDLYIEAMELLPGRQEAYLQYLVYKKEGGELSGGLRLVSARARKRMGAELCTLVADLYFSGDAEHGLTPDYGRAAQYYRQLEETGQPGRAGFTEAADLLAGDRAQGDAEEIHEVLQRLALGGRMEEERRSGIAASLLSAGAYISNRQFFRSAGIDGGGEAESILTEIYEELQEGSWEAGVTEAKPGQRLHFSKQEQLKETLGMLASVCVSDPQSRAYDPERAVWLYGEAMEHAGTSGERRELRCRQVLAAELCGDGELTERLFGEFIEAYPEAGVYLMYSSWLLDEGRIVEAARWFRKASQMEGAREEAAYESLSRRLADFSG